MSELVGSRALADGDVTDSARSSASYEFATRIIESNLVHLCDPGVEVTNKPHERCTVVRGASCPKARLN
ncbi:uncharacterized protein MICPUCDRAFT_55133 [Micromonas pusilla CCMP1545]|jgi:hypothetical protein|uniref:Predicted protein n=1 Tax=Micromonas pusilla (strain CCMP1545) TaxID=564608 RepID=C1MJX0_MICPC|nr:uncharacterized protein MICPUCDRAFT_55133 [Micromonas pusilla CCMP1545]EEH59660.1 predicted protein [Micromonas pusilla CCMP1545]|eukprot:XP_003056284.1 predicted protein [Micromonas pusilla CCMP1545]